MKCLCDRKQRGSKTSLGERAQTSLSSSAKKTMRKVGQKCLKKSWVNTTVSSNPSRLRGVGDTEDSVCLVPIPAFLCHWAQRACRKRGMSAKEGMGFTAAANGSWQTDPIARGA